MKVWTIVVLLLSIGFTMMHEIKLSLLSHHEHNVQTYIDEISGNAHQHEECQSDLCLVHHVLHLPYLLPDAMILFYLPIKSRIGSFCATNRGTKINFSLFTPPKFYL